MNNSEQNPQSCQADVSDSGSLNEYEKDLLEWCKGGYLVRHDSGLTFYSYHIENVPPRSNKELHYCFMIKISGNFIADNFVEVSKGKMRTYLKLKSEI